MCDAPITYSFFKNRSYGNYEEEHLALSHKHFDIIILKCKFILSDISEDLLRSECGMVLF